MHDFDPNDYRKRVLAAVERRGGLAESDAFELYDIPLAEAATLSDGEVEARIAQVWALWQKLRDHPKFRVLAGLLVDAHPRLSEPLLHTGSRLAEAERVRQLRGRRDAERYEMLDIAIERLVQRHGGIPAAKIAGLEDIGRMGGLTVPEIAAHIRRHRIIDESPTPAPAPVAAVLSVERRRQIRTLLAEYERLLPDYPAPTLLALLRLDFTAAHRTAEIRLRAEALRARTRELPPGRVRVVLDELLVHIADVLEPGGDQVDAYLQAVVDAVTDQLRPQVRAAVLVEDLLVAADFDYLLGEAITAGLDRATAERVLTTLTDELGTVIEGREHLAEPEGRSGRSDSGTTTSGPPGGRRGGERASGGAPDPAHWQRTPYGTYTGDDPGTRDTTTGSAATGTRAGRPWEAALRAARGALRAGRPTEAAGFVEDARRGLGTDAAGATSVRAVAEEVERVLGEAAVHWRAAVSACAGKRFVEALNEHLDFLERRAADVPNPDARGDSRASLTGRARAAVIEAGRMFERAPAAPPDARLAAVLAVLEVCADHAEALAALAQSQVSAPGQVTASRKADGTVVISWAASPTGNVEYRVTRLLVDGSWRVVGRTRGTALEDGGAEAGPVPVYGVVASISGRASAMIRSDGAPQRSADGEQAGRAVEEQPSGMPTVRGLAERGGLLVFDWPTGLTEVMVVARPDAPPIDPQDPAARRWKITNMRYELDGGVRIPVEIPRPCHLAVASCRREPTGTLTVAAGFAAAARMHWTR
ncbi:Ig-like domain repeat protein [Nocardia yunnanensis]|uniref:Ig-like domain repeat protein n=1 Tax=Nocardia yunnanensis TaxID=2382165 RepID=A0A386ZJ67_9NOCA|nr:Ig-like domain repeat protein [Nocardia yunnanensis]AYF77293.1 Ig-like domain repeat protein [Nocardia yunnanensis]